jgi:hypothetical protein
MLASMTGCSTLAGNNRYTAGRVRIPDAAIVTDVNRGPTWREYNALAKHAKDLRAEVIRQQCYKRAAEREARCAWLRVRELEQSWLPARIVPGQSCTIPEPECLKEYER